MDKIYDCTFVTALYDIGRDKTDGRTISNYIEWMKHTLTLNEPLVIYLDKTLEHLIKDINYIRLLIGFPTLIIITLLEEIPCYWMKNKVKNIINSYDWKLICKHQNDITNLNELYVCIQYSKFGWIENTFEKINWNSKYFSWIDIGISRFFNNRDNLSFNKNFLDHNQNKFIIQGSVDKLNIINDYNSYIGSNECILKGTFFIANKNMISLIKNKIDYIVKFEMLEKNRIDNEQIALAIICKQNYELFFVFPDDNRYHLRQDLFQ